ncbi:MinD/ParA family protein [Wansuia hejianensis]|uniref:MinD/ParA family protein n=1 Tax=Wansuia hejianensis TaxID=2763667 RepID=A0A926F1L5_9FIRM|nr:MinD/ParA family protein [Wansuia hejianensis]MBC8590284.1 MinD/ParA family protein [Wansuia hejianensis]
MIDQASKLRTMVKDKNMDNPIKIYSILSGKGGVGKTNFSINLGIKLQQMGKKVLILDADIGMSNANIMLGMSPSVNLFQAIVGNTSLSNIIKTGPEGIDLISGGSDLFFMEDLNKESQEKAMEALKGLGVYDIIIIDNGAGISKQSLTFTDFAHEVILVSTPEPTAIMDAYRVLKAISIYKLKKQVKIVINQVPDISIGREAYNKLLNTANQFLDIELENLGFIFSDIRVNKAIMEQNPIVLRYPNSLASENIDKISKNLLGNKDFDYNVSSLKQLGNRIIKFFR